MRQPSGTTGRWSSMGAACRVLLLVPLVAASSRAADDPAEAAGKAFFESKIRPVLVEHCYECHAAEAEQIQGGLLVDSRAGLRRGGDSGPAVVPHEPDESLLLDALRYEGFEMPPRGRLPAAVIADFESWIASGAVDPREGATAVAAQGVDLASGRDHWAFQPLADPPVPDPELSDWARSDIDRFILQRLEAEGLAPGPDADRAALLRRVYFDLTGLPPTRSELQAFLNAPASDALEGVVDRLLQSPRFGERWAQHWLDMARFSESTGGGRSLLYGQAWRYRDYVIRAFNEDKPYDRFILEQVAGDLLPYATPAEGSDNLVATALLMLGPHNYENQDKERLRMDVVDEQVDVLGRIFLGMTIGCARCHDHKFDPIPTADYYALAGIFRSTEMLVDGNVSGWTEREVPVPPSVREQLDEHARAVADVEQRLKERKAELEQARQELPLETLDNHQAELKGQWTESSAIKGYLGEGYVHTTDQEASARYAFSSLQPGRYEVRVSYTPGANRSSRARVLVQHAAGKSEQTIDQRQQPAILGRWVSLGAWELGEATTVDLLAEGSDGHLIADGVQLIRLGTAAEGEEDSFARTVALEANIEELQAELTRLEASAPPQPATVMAVREAEDAGDYHICIRGDVHNLGPVVPRGVLSVLSDRPALEIPPGASGRLQLAEWIASRENPLTARVLVNRIWLHLFGTGIVRTVDNFGLPGEPPSHPELLDHLARRLIEQGWSIKSLIREIVLSRTYQLDSRAAAEAEALDPENRLLSHQNRRRRDAEALRDAIFALSGQLDLTVGGNTIRPGTQNEYGYTFESTRRAVYLPVFRNRLPDLFAVFDFADPNLSAGQRNVSTLSTQALYLLNSPLVMQQAEATAARLLAEPDLDAHQRIDALYLEALGRPPTPGERRLAADFVGDATELHVWARLCQAVIASIDFLHVQ